MLNPKSDVLNMFESKGHLIVHSKAPYNAEPPLDRLRSAFITAQADFYVRSHGNIPQIDADKHRLVVDGLVERPLDLSMTELRTRFSPRTVTAVMQCAGNRRADMLQVAQVSGDPWAPGAIGNAAWTGVALGDILQAAGASDDRDLHVAFTSCDEIELEGEGRFFYSASIPITKAMSPEVLLAFAMNGEDLAPAHGFPVRVVVPGFAGVRSPKWLSRVTVQAHPSDNHMQQRDYKMFPSNVTADTVDWTKGVTINDMPINAAICVPSPHATLKAGVAPIRGYAVASAREIVRVDVSCDGGRTWSLADLEGSSPWSWTFWSASLDLPKGERELAVRAWDSAGQTQPAAPDDTWNFKGYLSAAWHRVRVSVV